MGTGLESFSPTDGHNLVRAYDEVELRAHRDGNSVAVHLSRASADEQRLLLEADGWVCEICETCREGPTDGPGAWSRWTAARSHYASVRRTTAALIARHALLRRQCAALQQAAQRRAAAARAVSG